MALVARLFDCLTLPTGAPGDDIAVPMDMGAREGWRGSCIRHYDTSLLPVVHHKSYDRPWNANGTPIGWDHIH
jgi:hypothetical protein